MTLECAVGADVGAGVGDGIVGDRVGDFVGAVMASGVLATALLEMSVLRATRKSRAACKSPRGDLIGHELRRAATQGSRLTSSDPCLGKEPCRWDAPAER